MINPFSFASTMASSSASLWRGTIIRHREIGNNRPNELLELYDMEGCPYCKNVREVLTELDLNAKIFPCPKGGSIYRNKVQEMGGKQQFPYLVDPNTGKSMYESVAIIDYLFAQYGSGKTPLTWSIEVINKTTSAASGIFRPNLGINKRPSKQPKALLELYSFESSPFSKPVRERLTELEIPYILRNFGKYDATDFIIPQVRKHMLPSSPPKGPVRRAMYEKYKKLQVPLLIDPNTNSELFESEAILKYLDEEYSQT